MRTIWVRKDYSKVVSFRLMGLLGCVHHAAGRVMAAADCYVGASSSRGLLQCTILGATRLRFKRNARPAAHQQKFATSLSTFTTARLRAAAAEARTYSLFDTSRITSKFKLVSTNLLL